MGQLSIYLPDELEKQLRRHARRARKSVSAYIAQLESAGAVREVNAAGHPLDVLGLFGSVPDLKAPADAPPEVPSFGAPIPDRHRRVRRVSRRR